MNDQKMNDGSVRMIKLTVIGGSLADVRVMEQYDDGFIDAFIIFLKKYYILLLLWGYWDGKKRFWYDDIK